MHVYRSYKSIGSSIPQISGNFQPLFSPSNNLAINYNEDLTILNATYSKVGNLCTINVTVDQMNFNFNAQLTLHNLPFPCISRSVSPLILQGFSSNFYSATVVSNIEDDPIQGLFFQYQNSFDATNRTTFFNGSFVNGFLQFSLTYETNDVVIPNNGLNNLIPQQGYIKKFNGNTSTQLEINDTVFYKPVLDGLDTVVLVGHRYNGGDQNDYNNYEKINDIEF